MQSDEDKKKKMKDKSFIGKLKHTLGRKKAPALIHQQSEPAKPHSGADNRRRGSDFAVGQTETVPGGDRERSHSTIITTTTTTTTQFFTGFTPIIGGTQEEDELNRSEEPKSPPSAYAAMNGPQSYCTMSDAQVGADDLGYVNMAKSRRESFDRESVGETVYYEPLPDFCAVPTSSKQLYTNMSNTQPPCPTMNGSPSTVTNITIINTNSNTVISPSTTGKGIVYAHLDLAPIADMDSLSLKSSSTTSSQRVVYQQLDETKTSALNQLTAERSQERAPK